MDCLEGLKGLPDEVVQCVVTSPPYWGLRDYGTAEWEGGDPKCNHMGEPMRTKANINKNTGVGFDKKNKENREFFKSICAKCGAKRIDKQIGLETTPGEYIIRMVELFREVKRVLRKDGTLWLNIGDCYVTSPPGNKIPQGFSQTRPSRKKHGVGPETVDLPKKNYNDGQYKRKLERQLGHGEDRNEIYKKIRTSGLKPKDLMMMPVRLAIALQEDGWWIRSDIIWHKPNPMPESCKDRPTSSYEHVFLMTKSGTSQYWVHRDNKGSRKKPKPDYRWIDNLENIEYKEKPHMFNKEKMICPMCNGIGRIKGWYGEIKCELCEGDGEIKRWKRINLWRGHDYYYDADAIRESQTGNAHSRGKGITPKSAPSGSGIKSNISFHESTSKYVEIPGGRNKRNVWSVPSMPYSEAHFATYPPELIIPCILAGTSAKGCCPGCGAPWERITEKVDTGMKQKLGSNLEQYKGSHGTIHRQGRGKNYKSENPVTYNMTTGWQPTCFCGGDPIPCIILDPFLGSGTTLGECRKNNRIGIGFELNPDYEKFIIKRSMTDIPRLETYFMDITEENDK